MEPTVSGPTTDFVVSSVLWAEVRHLLELLGWALVAGLTAAAGVWCCGYVVREAWFTVGPALHRPRRAATPGGAADGITREAALGILEIERYLADVITGRRPTRSEQDPDA